MGDKTVHTPKLFAVVLYLQLAFALIKSLV